MSQPPPKRVPDELVEGRSLGIQDYFRSLTNGLYFFWESSRFYEGSETYDPPSLADGAGVTTTVTVSAAKLGDFAEASFSLDLQGILLTAWVSASGVVSVRFQNETTGTIDLASGTLKVRVK